MIEPPKYSQLEIERRWLVDLSAIDLSSTPSREIEDVYIENSQLRLRKVSGSNEIVFKLGKKYGKRTPLAEPITNLYLTEAEYGQLSALPGRRVRKRRYSLRQGSLDVYIEPNNGLAILELEFSSEQSAKEVVPPRFAGREITNEPDFSGVALAQGRVSPEGVRS